MLLSTLLLGNFDRFSTDIDKLTDGLPDGSTDKSNNVWMDRNFPGYWKLRKFQTGILVSTITMNLADGWTDGTDDRHTDGQTEFQVDQVFKI